MIDSQSEAREKGSALIHPVIDAREIRDQRHILVDNEGSPLHAKSMPHIQDS